MARLIGLVFCAFMLPMAAHAGELPTTFLGSWTNNDGASDYEVTGIYVGPRTYHEPGYNCEIKLITAKNDTGSVNRGLVYVVDMACGGDGPNPRYERVREVWALRNVGGKDVLVMSGVAGPTYPSISILQR